MKLTVTFLLLPAALAWPSYNGHGHGHDYSHPGYEAYKSGHHHASGAGSPSGSAGGPFGMKNVTASQAGTAVGNADSTTSTAYISLYNTIYQTLSDTAPAEAASAVGGPTGACGGTVTVTNANTVTVTVTGGGAEAVTSVPPETQAPVTPKSEVPVTHISVTPSSTAPETALPPVKQSSVHTPVAPISQAASPVEKAVTPSSSSTSSTATHAAEAAASTPSTASATPQAQSASPPGGKRGLFIPTSGDGTQADYVTAFNNNPGKISWIVNQFSKAPDNLSSKFNYVPQCYDKDSDVSYPGQAPHPWTTNAQSAVAAGEKYFLAFGEANTNNSQNFYMDASTAASTFMKMLQPYATENGVKIGSPGTLAESWDIQWQNDFLDACAPLGCKISWISAHWFSPCGSATAQDLADTFYGTIDTYKSIAQKHSAQYGIELKVWVDNFSLNCDSATQQAFLDIVVPKMEADDMVERYGYVSRTEVSDGNGFLNTDGSISDLGLHYANM